MDSTPLENDRCDRAARSRDVRARGLQAVHTVALIIVLASPAACVADVGDAAQVDAGADTDGGASDVGQADVDAVDFRVNGHLLTARERRWMVHVARYVVPRLRGDRGVRIRTASRAAWWSLKEGIFDADRPLSYSNCNTLSGDRTLGPLGVCPDPHRAWQVGLAAVQVPGHTLDELRPIARHAYRGWTIGHVLGDIAERAGYARGGATWRRIVSSTGRLRISWLLRSEPVGFTIVERAEVVPECIEGARSWCYGTGWDTTRWYAPTREAMTRSILAIQRILREIAPR